MLDWWLPGEDGLSLLRRFRMRDRTTPVIFLTARDAIPERVAGLNAGADILLDEGSGWGIVLQSAIEAVPMSLSTVVVAIKAQFLRRAL